MTQPREWLLLFIGLPGGKFPTDQLRVMKGMFLFSREGPASVRDLYHFEPYDYGPFATPVYGDLDGLEAQGLIRTLYVMGTNQRVFELTSTGDQHFRDLIGKASKDALDILGPIKELVTSLGFADLLRYVYDKYPHYASRSLLNQ